MTQCSRKKQAGTFGITLICSIVITLFCTTSAHAIAVVSDLDDTIKHTHVGDVLETIYNGLFSKKPFGGMAALYHATGTRLTVVSGSPKQLKPLVKEFLEDNEFPRTELHLRRFVWNDMQKYKIRTLTDVINASGDHVILVGDDTEKDPEVYMSLKNSHGDKVKAVYVRRVRARKLPAGAVGFFHPFEIVVQEWAAGRFSDATALTLANDMNFEFAILPSRFFPKHVQCPKNAAQFQMDKALQSSNPDMRQAAQTVIDGVLVYCGRR